MKKLLPLLLILTGCVSTLEEKAAITVSKEVQGDYKDPFSYEPIHYEVKLMFDINLPPYIAERDSLADLFLKEQITLRQFMQKDSALERKYHDQFLRGWNVKHIYRKRNEAGIMEKKNAFYFVDRSFATRKIDSVLY
jgi:hypothetical protein